jgi:hypothetical protein
VKREVVVDLKERHALGEQAARHWYYVSKARMITRHLQRSSHSILDVGAGEGWFSRWLLENGYGQSAICVDPGYEADCESSVAGLPLLFRRSVSSIDQDLVLLMDVLEHVDDDVGLLARYWRSAPAGTTFIITVPAFNFLWSSHDVYLEHRRRYTLGSLSRTIRKAGATPDRLHYFFGSVFPLAAIVRLVRRYSGEDASDMRPVPELVNSVLTGMCSLEVSMARWNKLAGLSVVARLTK